MSKRPSRSLSWVLALAGGIAGGCLLVAPLDELPSESSSGAGGKSGKGGQSGSGGTGMTNDGGGGVGDTPGGGSSGKGAGSSGKGGKGGQAGAGGSGNDGGSGEAGAPGGTGGCTTNAECVERAHGDPYRCEASEGRCVKLKTDECPLVYGPFKDPNAVYFGVFASLPQIPQQATVVWTERLALDEINAVDGGLPSGPDGARRPLVMVVCNNDTMRDPEMITKVVDHLTDDVRAPALIATLRPDDLNVAFQRQIPNDLFFLNPVSVTSLFTDENYKDEGLMWNLLGEPRDFAPAYRRLLLDLEAYLRILRPEIDQLKVAVVTDDDVFAQDLQTYVYAQLEFNGVNAALNQDNYKEVTIKLAQPMFADAAGEIIAFAPDVVISTGTDSMTRTNGILQQVEQDWYDSGKAKRPYFILSPYDAGDLDRVFDAIGTFGNFDPDTVQRYLGLQPAAASNTDLLNSFETRLGSAYAYPNYDTGNYYDAIYTLAYAMAAAEQPLTGSSIAAAMPKLFTGASFGVGPDEIREVYEALAEPGASVELEGTLGPPDFDGETGVRRATPGVFCFKDEEQLEQKIDVLRYNVSTDDFDGTYPCMTNFPPTE